MDATDVLDINVGGVCYTTSLTTLLAEPKSVLAQIFTEPTGRPKDNKGRPFIDRDGVLFRYVLDYLRNKRLVLPETFHEKYRLRQEAEYFGLPGLVSSLGGGVKTGQVSPGDVNYQDGNYSAGGTIEGEDQLAAAGMASLGLEGTKGEPGYVIVGYRGTFAFGRDGMADVKFRKLSRILVSGRVSICREVFGDTLNESRDPDRGTSDRYSARFYLKHTFIEQAFDALQEAGFRMVGSAGSGTNSAGESKPGMDSEENKWNHYNEFVFCRP